MIVLSAQQRARIASIAEQTYPDECCGLLVGFAHGDGSVVVTRIIESRNIRGDRARDRFEIDPQVRIDAERQLRGRAERVVGHYHSHPDHPAQPSATDRDMVFEPNLIWLIAGVVRGRTDALNAFRFDEVIGEFQSITLEYSTEPNA